MQVKFRGKRVDGSGWVVGSLIGDNVIVGKIIDFNDEYFNTEFWYKVEPSSIGMFTGLNDKNGKEIYGAVGENGGDIVKFKASWGDYIGKIEYGIIGEDGEKHAAFGYYVIRNGAKESFYLSLIDINQTATEIIGNAFDNPELLEK